MWLGISYIVVAIIVAIIIFVVTDIGNADAGTLMPLPHRIVRSAIFGLLWLPYLLYVLVRTMWRKIR